MNRYDPHFQSISGCFKYTKMVAKNFKKIIKLDPVGSTVRYEMMKLCTGSV